MNDYVLIFTNGSVLDSYRPQHQSEEEYIAARLLDGDIAEIHRRGDGVVVYEKETPK